MKLKSLFNKFAMLYHTANSYNYVKYLKMRGAKIGDNVIFRDPCTTQIDMTRPSLVSIGNDVDFNKNFQILTHDWSSHVFRNYFHDFINSSGPVIIGNNIYFGTNVTVLKGVTIGDNCIIGAGSLVTKSIPANSVAAGIPCRVVCSLEDYYEKRKTMAFEEAKEYIRSIRQRYDREPKLSEMREEFIYFVDKDNIEQYGSLLPIKFQLGSGYRQWISCHQAKYKSFEDFLNDIQ